MSKCFKRKSPKAKRPKTKLGLPDLDHSRSAVLDSLCSATPTLRKMDSFAVHEAVTRRYCAPYGGSDTFSVICPNKQRLFRRTFN